MRAWAGTKNLPPPNNQDQIDRANGEYCNKLLRFSALYFWCHFCVTFHLPA
jgi:hypothetical protein